MEITAFTVAVAEAGGSGGGKDKARLRVDQMRPGFGFINAAGRHTRGPLTAD
jgi:hypothetical protein